MSYIYFPSCKLTAYLSESSKKIQDYLGEKYGMNITGCCRPNHNKLTEQDIAVYICNTCAAFIREDAPQAKAISVWEFLAEDDEFPWRDYHGEKMTVQDCWRVYDNRTQQDAIRKILERMNIEIVEIENNFEKTDFCGTSLLEALSPQNGEFAPIRFIENARDKFIPHSKEDQEKIMKEYCTQFTTDKVVCYCTACVQGVKLGGVKGIHLLDLMMNAN